MRAAATWMLVTLLAIAGLVGCEGEISMPSVADVKQAVTDTVSSGVEVAKQTANAAGNIEVQIEGTPVSTSGCYAAVYPQSGGRPNILQVKSYHDSSAESFPSFFFRGHLTQRAPGELVGQTITGKVYVAAAKDGELWQTPEDQPGQLTVSTVDGDKFSGELRCALVSSVSGQRKESTAKLSGSIK